MTVSLAFPGQTASLSVSSAESPRVIRQRKRDHRGSRHCAQRSGYSLEKPRKALLGGWGALHATHHHQGWIGAAPPPWERCGAGVGAARERGGRHTQSGPAPPAWPQPQPQPQPRTDRRCASPGCWISMINTAVLTDSVASPALVSRPFSRFD